MSASIVILLVGLVALMALGIPICFALMSVSSVILILFFGPAQMNILNAAFVNQMQSDSLLAIPMFALMAAFLQTSGIGSDIYEFFHKWMGGIKGGLAMATVATTAVIAAMSGVAATATISMGLIALPEMIKRGYDKSLACGPVLSGGCLGPIIPPSTIMIIMASYTGVSAGWLFMGGVLPGVGLAILFIIYIGIRCIITPSLGPAIPKEERPTWGEKFKVFGKVVIPIGIIVLVLGCIYAGIATPTEASGVGATASLLYALLSRKLTFRNLRDSLVQTMEVSAMLMWILMGGAAYNSLVNITRLSDVVANAFRSAQLDGLPLMLVIFALFFVMGMFLDTTPIIMIAIPILLPIIKASSLDLHATILILCITLCLGMITPPFGINMFYLLGVAPPGIDTKVMYKAVMPYVVIFVVALVFMMLFPQIIVAFPNSAMGY
ncbi:MAG: TRAP transporter large permease subunit [Oscillospiraceae bacterium]|nr:TRAP transporter large permease subunit [Oscillospiraceae bacterium]